MLFNSAVKIILLVIFVFLFGIGFHWSLLFLPFVIIGAILVGTTIGLFITPISMLYNDIAKIISIGLTFLMYITPVVYAMPREGIMRTLMEINPFTPIILTSRDILTGSSPEYFTYYLAVLAACIPLFLLGLVAYRISIPIIVERMSA